jgi:hypothetical protein
MAAEPFFFVLIRILSIFITNSIEQNLSWEADICSAGQEILHILWNPKISYHEEYHLLGYNAV